MAWAQETKNLVAEIKTSHRDRTKYLDDLKGDTHEMIARFQQELKDMAKDLKEFLAKSEETRKTDFNKMIGEIQTKIKEIKRDVKDLLLKSEEQRITDFKTLMKDIAEDIAGIKKRVADLINSYRSERKEAADYWRRLGVKAEEAPAEEAPAAPKKMGGKKK